MSQKPGGIEAMGSGIWTHTPLRIRTELFVMSTDGNFGTLSPFLLLHRCSKMNYFSALPAKPFRAYWASFWGVKRAKVTLKRTLRPSTLLFSLSVYSCSERWEVKWVRIPTISRARHHCITGVANPQGLLGIVYQWEHCAFCTHSHEGSPGPVHTNTRRHEHTHTHKLQGRTATALSN